MQTLDDGASGLQFGDDGWFGADLCFWHSSTSALDQYNNGYTHVGSSFVEPAEGPSALNNGEERDMVFTAFQVLLVKPVDGSKG
jgi:hypothetical protein